MKISRQAYGPYHIFYYVNCKNTINCSINLNGSGAGCGEYYGFTTGNGKGHGKGVYPFILII